ncbi:MAG: protoporphyrinogen/coproporphyrinogen oxidase [Candidatus Polarisedimenticolia bacterium]
MILILGGGLTGLSAALHLQDSSETRVLEREERPGGLCRSFTQDGFTFDLTGHLLHLRRPEIRDLVMRLVPEERFERIDRRAFIHSQGVLTPYPFQVNTHGLPPEVVAECLLGFIEAAREAAPSSQEAAGLSFRRWVLKTFGTGIARHFMFPYNEKLWLCDLDEMTCEWASWSIPRPSLKDVVEGALGLSRAAFGYNPSFFYPKAGGIEVLPAALASRVRNVSCGSLVERVDVRRRVAHVRGGEAIPYQSLVSTLPLPRLVEIASGLPEWTREAARALRHVAVVNVNLGIDRVLHTDKHWIYFPEKDYVFYRAGFPASFTPAAAPPGCSSIYLEIAVPPGTRTDDDALAAQCREGLLRAGLLEPSDRIVTRAIFHIDPAYVIHDPHRREMLPRLLDELRSHGIHSAGRYGAWYYNSMEDSLAEGRALALELAPGGGALAGAGEVA